jgi:hypothetical protein
MRNFNNVGYKQRIVVKLWIETGKYDDPYKISTGAAFCSVIYCNILLLERHHYHTIQPILSQFTSPQSSSLTYILILSYRYR